MSQLQMNTTYELLGRNPVHPFPARMSAEIAIEYLLQAKPPVRVLDPMMGSGTVIALARANGHRATGIDIDPLAVLMAKVWTTPIDFDQVRNRAAAVLQRALDVFSTLSLREAYPRDADSETKRFVRYWFDQYARRQLAALAISISKVRDRNIRAALWCAFSRLIITKQAGASLAKDLAHSRPHKSFTQAPVKPFARFIGAVDHVLGNCIPIRGHRRGPRASTRLGDARKLKIRKASIDLVITSPPYLNAIDYMRCSKFSLVWMGPSAADLRLIRRCSIGTEVGDYRTSTESDKLLRRLKLSSKLSARHRALLNRFIEDMKAAVSEVARILVPGGRAVYVIGENTIQGVYVRNAEIVIAVARRAGLRLERQATRLLPKNRRYLPPPSNVQDAPLNTRMRREVVLSFRKPKRHHISRNV